MEGIAEDDTFQRMSEEELRESAARIERMFARFTKRVRPPRTWPRAYGDGFDEVRLAEAEAKRTRRQWRNLRNAYGHLRGAR